MRHGRFVSSYRQNYSMKQTWILNKSEKSQLNKGNDPADIYLLNVNNRNTRRRRKICSKLIIKTPERCQWHFVYT